MGSGPGLCLYGALVWCCGNHTRRSRSRVAVELGLDRGDFFIHVQAFGFESLQCEFERSLVLEHKLSCRKEDSNLHALAGTRT